MTIRVGDAEIRRVEEMTLSMPMAMFGDPALLAEHEHWLRPRFLDADGNWDMVIHSWVATIGGRVVVIDPCNGNARTTGYPVFDGLDTPYIERFAGCGIRPEDVDFVFCTHLHSDHCGWNTRLRNGRYVPTFPNARYIIAQAEYDLWNPTRPGYVEHPASNRAIFDNSVRPLVEAGQADLVADTHTILPGLTMAPAPGHTRGHAVLHLAAQDAAAVFTGDCFHHPIELVRPEIDAGACEDFAVALATRRRLIRHCLDTDALILPSHFPAPYAGRLREDAIGVRFVPLGDAD